MSSCRTAPLIRLGYRDTSVRMWCRIQLVYAKTAF